MNATNESSAGSAPTILVVDDNEANRALASATLTDEGYRVVLADGGAAGLAAFRAERPDCVLLDVRMPEVDGFAVCEQLRALPGGVETPVVFLTALRDVETFDRALRAGADDFLTKPVRPTELLVRVQSALRVRRLGQELREHYTLLRRQRDDLVRLQLQKERLMAFVVHDLKNPVNTMDLLAQLVLRERGLTEDGRDSAMKIRVEARQLTRMIINLLDVSKADEGKLTVQRADLALGPFIAEVLAELDVSARAHRVQLHALTDATRVYADEDLLRRTLANLVENAIRHAPPGSTVTVATTRDATGTVLRVADTGRGVSEPMREAIFDPFVQGSAGTDQPESRAGRGLGLAFCKLAVEAHGGRIWIEDAAPGAVFCVSLPDAQ